MSKQQINYRGRSTGGFLPTTHLPSTSPNGKLTLLRTNTMTVENIKLDEERLASKLKEIDGKIGAYTETAQEMIKYVITFSELVKNAILYYEFALDNEKREIVTEVFTELVFSDRKLDKYKAKEGFETLLCKDWLSGSNWYPSS